MTNVHTAIGEVLRTGIDALRGLGCSFAMADRGTHMLVWAEAVHGTGLRFLRNHEREICDAMGRGLHWSEDESRERIVGELDARGRCVLEAGPRALDLADALARTDGVGLVGLCNAVGTVFLPELAAHSAARGLGVLILIQPQCEQKGEAGGALLGLPSPAGGEDVLAIETRPGQLARPGEDFGPLIDRLAGADAAAAALRFLEPGREGGAGRGIEGHSRILFASFDPARGAGSGVALGELARLFSASPGADRGFGPVIDLGTRWRQAVAHGFDIEEQDWAYLYSLVGRTRVVTSERSRQQAG